MVCVGGGRMEKKRLRKNYIPELDCVNLEPYLHCCTRTWPALRVLVNVLTGLKKKERTPDSGYPCN